MQGYKHELRQLIQKVIQSILENDMKVNDLLEEVYLRANDYQDKELLEWYQYIEALIAYKKGAFSQAHDALELIFDRVRDRHYFDLEVKVLKTLGDIHYKIDDYNGALDYYLSCLELDTQVLYDIEDKPDILTVIGEIYKELGQFEVAMAYYEEALALYIKQDNPTKVMELQMKMAWSMLSEGDLEIALKAINVYFAEALSNGNDKELALAYEQYAYYYWLKQDMNSAKSFFEKSLKKMKVIGMHQELCVLLAEFGRFLYEEGEYESAMVLLTEGSKLVLDQSDCSSELEIYLYMAKIYEVRNQFEKAYYYFKKYHELKMIKDETWKTIKIKSIVNKYEYLRSDIKVKELQYTNDNFRIISDIGRDITSTIDFREVIQKVSERVFELFHSKTFLVGRLTGSKKMEVLINDGVSEHEVLIQNRSGRSYIFNLLKEAIINNDFHPAEAINQQLIINEYAFKGIRSYISSPLIFQGKSIGVIMVQSDRRKAFEESNLEVLKILSSYISIAIRNSAQSDELIEINRKLKELTEKDGLTKVYNRYALNKNIKRILRKAYTYEKSFGIVMIDVDFFKEYNDNYGHLAGDRCLIKVSKALSKTVEGLKDTHLEHVFRYGGDEFIMVLMNLDPEELYHIGEEIRKTVVNLNIEHKFSKCADKITLTIGIAVIKKESEDYESLFALADQALYNAKRQGRNNVKLLEYQ